MQQVERHIVVGSQELTNICFKAKTLYNQALYYLRQSTFGKIQHFSEYELTGLFAEFDEENYRALPAQTSQQIIKQLFGNYKSWYKARKEWKKHPDKFQGRPKLPKYKKEQYITIFTSQQVKIKEGYVCFPKNTISPIKTKVNNVAQVRIIPQPSCHIIEIIYEKETADLKLNQDNVLSLDLGLSNIATSANNVGVKPFIINGNPIKAFNQWYNKKKGFLTSVLKSKKFTSNKLEKLNHYRNCWIDDKMHKISRFIIDYCIENNIGTIVIGQNKGWKNEINIGRKNNQSFVNVPHLKLIDKVSYKAELVGIKVIFNEESYTSKCDSLALETVEKHEVYSGKRIKRGLFQSVIGKLINADENGACNIARKVIGDCFMKNIINSSCALQPYKINVL